MTVDGMIRRNRAIVRIASAPSRIGRSPKGVVEEVDGDLVRIQLGELERKLHSLLGSLAHADDPPCAELHADFLDQLAGLPALLPGVCGAGLGKEAPARLEVVVVAVNAKGGELNRLLPGEQTERASDVEVGLAAQHFYRPGDVVMVRWSGPRSAI